MNIVKSILVSITLFCFISNSYAEKINLSHLSKLFHEAIKHHAFPGGCIQAGTAKKILIARCFGYFTYSKTTPDQNDSLFDIASLTKVIATTSAIMKIYDAGKIKLNDKVIHYLPNFRGPTLSQTKLKARITILQLLTHTSGLPADNDLITSKNLTMRQRWQEILKTPVLNYPGTTYRYSDINFILLGKIIQKISGQPLNQFVYQTIFKPLGMNHTLYNPLTKKMSIVPTSYNEKQNALFKGIVDDPMARALGGVSGNAGLFSTIHDLGIFAQMMLNQGEYKGVRNFKASTVNFFIRRANIIPLNSRALGWDTVYNPKSILPLRDRSSGYFGDIKFYEAPKQFTAGFYINPNAYGHTGYTGTSIWISKKYGIYVILLTNRVTPFPRDVPEKYFRQRINSVVWKSLGFTKRNLTYIEPKPDEKGL